MDYKNKQDKYNKIMGRIGKNLKPIFDRMIEKQTEKIREKTPVDYTEVMPSCGITTRNIPLTEEQLERWGVKYHQLFLGKPSGDIYIDDKGIKDEDFFNTGN